MPLRKQHSPNVLTAAVLALGVAAAAPAAASAACVQAPTTKAFSKVGDNADYSVAPGGDFESGAAGWTLAGGAKVVSGNETLGFTKGPILKGSKSLSMPVGSTATSPEFCVDETHPYFRFMAKPASSMAGYKAIVIYRDGNGGVKTSQFTSSQEITWGEGNWSASAVSPLAANIPLNAGATASVQLRFESTGNPVAVGIGFWGRFTGGDVGATNIDSVLVDPYRRG